VGSAAVEEAVAKPPTEELLLQIQAEAEAVAETAALLRVLVEVVEVVE